MFKGGEVMIFEHHPNHIFLKDKKNQLIAEVTFPTISNDIVDINHTYVDESFRGQGLASQIMFAAYNEIKSQNKKAIASCTFAETWFQKHPDCKDILK